MDFPPFLLKIYNGEKLLKLSAVTKMWGMVTCLTAFVTGVRVLFIVRAVAGGIKVFMVGTDVCGLVLKHGDFS